MSPFQWGAILVLAALAVRDLAAYLRGWHRSRLRLFRMGVVVAAALAIGFPDVVQKAARALGIGRGADFVLYLSVLVYLVLISHLYIRSVRLEGRLVQMVRETAIRNARLGTTPPPCAESDEGGDD